jgi:hypothetical protein
MNNFVVEVNGTKINLSQADIVELLNSNQHLIAATQQFALQKQQPSQLVIQLAPSEAKPERKETEFADIDPAVLHKGVDNCKSFLLTFHSTGEFTKQDAIHAANGRWAYSTILQQYSFIRNYFEYCFEQYVYNGKTHYAKTKKIRLTAQGKAVLPHITHRTSGR